jgi:23S rRNA pseudouridine1911/1915/1917 synthase
MDVVTKNGKNAISNYYVLDRSTTHSLLMVGIETGRTHQIRVHMKYIGHPIEGDQVYSKNNKYATRQMLHAYRLEFVHPLNNKKMSIKSKLPKDFEKLMNRLNLNLSLEKIDEIIG